MVDNTCRLNRATFYSMNTSTPEGKRARNEYSQAEHDACEASPQQIQSFSNYIQNLDNTNVAFSSAEEYVAQVISNRYNYCNGYRIDHKRCMNGPLFYAADIAAMKREAQKLYKDITSREHPTQHVWVRSEIDPETNKPALSQLQLKVILMLVNFYFTDSKYKPLAKLKISTEKPDEAIKYTEVVIFTRSLTKVLADYPQYDDDLINLPKPFRTNPEMVKTFGVAPESLKMRINTFATFNGRAFTQVHIDEEAGNKHPDDLVLIPYITRQNEDIKRYYAQLDPAPQKVPRITKLSFFTSIAGTIAHEIGHTFGLIHLLDTDCNIMRTITFKECRHKSFSPGYRAVLTYMFGSPKTAE